jgi:allophanate hydrolase
MSPNTPSELSLDRATLHAAYAAGRLHPAEVVALIHRRIVALEDPGIFLHLIPVEHAAAAAQALPPFDPARFPLWGLPVVVKDNIDVACPPRRPAPASPTWRRTARRPWRSCWRPARC